MENSFFNLQDENEDDFFNLQDKNEDDFLNSQNENKNENDFLNLQDENEQKELNLQSIKYEFDIMKSILNKINENEIENDVDGFEKLINFNMSFFREKNFDSYLYIPEKSKKRKIENQIRRWTFQ